MTTTLCFRAENSVETECWSGIFTSFNTEAKSSLFIRQLTSTCISTILRLRKVFPDDHFEEKNFEGLKLKLLKSTTEENYTFKIKQWLEGAFEAFEKKYLKRLMLDIQDAESNLTLEVYTMTFSYNNEAVKTLLSTSTLQNDGRTTMSNTKLNTIKLLQMCHAVTQTYSNLPSKVKLSMRLSYCDNTPKNYQPKGYMAWELTEFQFPKKPKSVEIGTISTQHHFFKLLNKSCLSNDLFKNLENPLERDAITLPMKKSNQENELDSVNQKRRARAKRELCFGNIKKRTNLLNLNEGNTENTILVPKKNLQVSKNQFEKHKPLAFSNGKIVDMTMTDKINVPNDAYLKADVKNHQVRCACLSSEKSETMFSCLSCKFLVHAECYGILEFDPSKKVRFICHSCHQPKNNLKCHDKVIISLKSSSDQQKLSILRRVLRHCTKSNVYTITLKNMEKIAGANCPKNIVNIVLNKMIEIGVAIKQVRRKSYLLDKQILANELIHYFYKVQSSNPSQLQVSSYSLRSSENVKRKNNVNELLINKKNKHATPVLQETLIWNSQNSQQSCDIFF